MNEEKRALNFLQQALKAKYCLELPNLAKYPIPFTVKGNISFATWAVMMQQENHPWYGIALRLARLDAGK